MKFLDFQAPVSYTDEHLSNERTWETTEGTSKQRAQESVGQVTRIVPV